MSTQAHAVRHFVWWALRHIVLLAVVLLVSGVLYGNTVGIPDPLLRRVLDRLNRGGFAFDVGSARLVGVRNVRLRHASIYRKQLLGDPMLEADTVRIRISPLASLQGRSGIVAVEVHDAIWRPKQGRAKARRKQGRIRRLLQFKAEVTNCRLYDITLERTTFELEGAGQDFRVRNLESSIGGNGHTGRLGGQLDYDMAARVLSGRLVTNLDPNALTTFFTEHDMTFCHKLVTRFVFPSEPPRGEFRFDRRMGVKGDIRVDGDFRMRDCTYRGVELLRADGAVRVENRDATKVATVDDLLIVRREGMARVGFTVTPDDKRIAFEAETSLRPLAMARMVGVLTNLLTQTITFDGSSTVTADGVVDYGGAHTQTDLKGTVQADHVGLERFGCDSGSCDVRMVGDRVTLTNVEASVYGGTASGSIVLTAPPRGERQVHFQADMHLRDADFERFMKSASTSESKREYAGRLSGRLALEGTTGEHCRKALNGNGSVEIRDGRVFLLPLFGGLSRLMTRIIPGLDFVLRQSDAGMEFRIGSGRIETDKLVVEGDILSLKGEGAYVLGGDLDFDAQVKLMKEHSLVSKLVRVLTYPISKLFEFRLRGTLDDPSWYPVNFSMDLLERIGLRKRESEAEADSLPPAEDVKDIE